MPPVWELLDAIPGLKPPIDKHWSWWLLWLPWAAFWLAIFGVLAWVLVEKLIG